jgi:hypothetical protein
VAKIILKFRVGDEDGEFAAAEALTGLKHRKARYKLQSSTNFVIKGDQIEYGLSCSTHGQRRKRLSNCVLESLNEETTWIRLDQY